MFGIRRRRGLVGIFITLICIIFISTGACHRRGASKNQPELLLSILRYCVCAHFWDRRKRTILNCLQSCNGREGWITVRRARMDSFLRFISLIAW